MAAQFFRARAWWQLDSVGPSALHVARSVVSLLDAAAYVEGLPDDDPGLTALDAAGCFASGIFDPGPEGWGIVREWQLADEASAGPEDLLAQLAHAAARDGPGAHLASLARPTSPGCSAPRRGSAFRVRSARPPSPPQIRSPRQVGSRRPRRAPRRAPPLVRSQGVPHTAGDSTPSASLLHHQLRISHYWGGSGFRE